MAKICLWIKTQYRPLPLIPTFHELNADVPLGSVKHAIELPKNRKVSETDGTFAEVMKCGGEALAAVLHAVLELCWRNQCFPWFFKDTNIITMHKNKGCGYECSSYLGISLHSVAGKVLSLVRRASSEVIADKVLLDVNVFSLHRAQPLMWCSHWDNSRKMHRATTSSSLGVRRPDESFRPC